MLQLILLCLVCHVVSFIPSNSVFNLRKFSSRIRSDYVLFPKSVRLFSSGSSDGIQGDLVDRENLDEGKNGYYISPDQLAALKDSVDIISFIESYNLKGFTRKSENGASAVCPFHDDHNPSLSISGDRKLFKCFACGEGGDVFKFVRSYGALKGEEMTFYDSVKFVAKKVGDTTIGINTKSYKSNFRESEALLKKKKRLQLCNMAAADFFAKALINFPVAGAARAHLRDRGLSPSTVRRFAIGYAPDSYFKTGKPWGEGSLVEHLRSLDFSAKEIIDAGLATKTKRPAWKDVAADRSNYTETEEDDFEGLMDRFRERIIVPIFEEKGENVVGFGGRVVGSSDDDLSETKFRPPKYLNTKETPIFSKKVELFGLPYAKEAIDALKSEGLKSPIVIVEGYMDAIALWEAGVKEIVASMGTALTKEQLIKAAKAAGLGGRIVLCLDNDEAGRMATERLCSTLVLAKVCETHSVEIVVAELPDGVKDPAEYFENNKHDKDKFRHKVLDKSLEWSQWYIQQILSGYDANAVHGTTGTFADICERVSDFISTFSLPTDRTRRAFEVAKYLSTIIAGSSTNSSSKTLQVQLESDLLSMVSRKAAAKEVVERRVEEVEGFRSPNKIMVLDRLFSGGVSSDASEIEMLARNATKNKSEKVSGKRPRASSSFSSTRRRTKMSRRIPKREPLTPHFTGIDIDNSADADWLNIPREKLKRKMKDLTFGSAEDNNEQAVFFNSNAYHGEQYITEEAKQAGYSEGIVKKDRAMLEKGIGVFLVEDQEHKAMAAEERLLRILVQHASSRNIMRDIISTGDATGVRPEIDWSCHERSWLFDFLVLRNHEIPTDIEKASPEILWDFLSHKEDAPPSAFVNPPHVDSKLFSARPVLENIEIDGHQALDETIFDNPALDYGDPSTSYHGEDDELGFESYDPSIYDVDIQRDESILDVDNFDPGKHQSESNDVVIDEKIQPASTLPLETSQQLRKSSGTLDGFFEPVKDIFANTSENSLSRSYLAELEVQEALAHLLRATAAKRINNVSENWMLASKLLDARLGVQGGGSSVVSGITELDSMNVGDLQLYCKSLMTRLQQLRQTVQQLDGSARQISLRLMEYTQGDSIEGKIPLDKQEKVCNMVDDFVNDLPDDYKPKEVKGLMNSMDDLSLFEDNDTDEDRLPTIHEEEEENLKGMKFEDDMRIIDEYWKGMDSDEYVWSMPDKNCVQGRAMPLATNAELEKDYAMSEEREPVDEAIIRIEEEWGEWEDFEPEGLIKNRPWNSIFSDEEQEDQVFPDSGIVNVDYDNQADSDLDGLETESFLFSRQQEKQDFPNDVIMDSEFHNKVNVDIAGDETVLSEWE